MTPSILEVMDDQQLFAAWFKDRATWTAWVAFFCAAFALPMTPEQLAIYQTCTGRVTPPSAPVQEIWLCIGRRGGKSFVLALLAVFKACFCSYAEWLAPGEKATIAIISTDRRQSRVIFRYVRALITRVPLLAEMIERETDDTIELSNSVTIEISVASHRSTRGYTFPLVALDEIAFFPTDDAAEPDYEILDAIRPGMATIPGAMLLCASSPYARRGALHDAHKRHFGKENDPVLFWQAPTRTMNPGVPQSVIDAAMERDPQSASSEFLAEFRSDLESYIDRSVVESLITPGVFERPPIAGVEYLAYVDPSGGSGSDSMCIAIGHRQDGPDGVSVAVVDAIRERRPPFDPEDCVRQFCDLLQSYNVREVVGDKYAGSWPASRFLAAAEIRYVPAERPTSDQYRDFLPLMMGHRVELVENPRMVGQLASLERRTGRSGRDQIGHPPGSHDDIGTVVAGLCNLIAAAPAESPTPVDLSGFRLIRENGNPAARANFENRGGF